MNKKSKAHAKLDTVNSGAKEMFSFRPSAHLTFSTVIHERERFVQCLQDTQISGVYVDLSHVEHCDSAGLALLIEAKRLCQFHQKAFSIDAMSSVVADLVEFCGVKTILS